MQAIIQLPDSQPRYAVAMQVTTVTFHYYTRVKRCPVANRDIN